jgi:hypothetical protein
VRTEEQTIQLTTDYRETVQRQEVMQRMELSGETPFCYLLQADCGQVSVGTEGERTALRTTVRMKLLYLDEGGAPMSAERSAEATAAVASLPDRGSACCGRPAERISGGDYELHLPVEFLLCSDRKCRLTAVTGGEVLESEEETERPSVVVRRVGERETLWDIAKQYRTDEELIRSVNELTGEAGGRLILIPRIG